MSTHFIFNQAGVVPGLPDGDFAGVHVAISDEGKVEAVQPLAQHPAFEAVVEQKVPATQETAAQEDTPSKEEKQVETPPEQQPSPPETSTPEATASEQV